MCQDNLVGIALHRNITFSRKKAWRPQLWLAKCFRCCMKPSFVRFSGVERKTKSIVTGAKRGI